LLSATRIVDTTLYPARPIGMLEACLPLSLEMLELWPAVQITFEFEGDDGEWELIVKPVAANSNLINVKVRPLETIHTLKCRIAVQRPESLAPSESLGDAAPPVGIVYSA
jgi:hypothetical protein